MATDGCILKAAEPLPACLPTSRQIGMTGNRQACDGSMAVSPALPLGDFARPSMPTSHLVPSEEPTAARGGGSSFSPLLISHKVLRDPTLRTIGSRSTTIGSLHLPRIVAIQRRRIPRRVSHG